MVDVITTTTTYTNLDSLFTAFNSVEPSALIGAALLLTGLLTLVVAVNQQ